MAVENTNPSSCDEKFIFNHFKNCLPTKNASTRIKAKKRISFHAENRGNILNIYLY